MCSGVSHTSYLACLSSPGSLATSLSGGLSVPCTASLASSDSVATVNSYGSLRDNVMCEPLPVWTPSLDPL